MASLLSMGAGAHEGIEEMLDRMMLEQREARAQSGQDETVRSNRANEDYRNRALDENTAYRKEMEAGRLQQAGVVEKRSLRDDARATLAMTPKDTPLSGRDIEDFTQAGVPRGMFNLDELQSTTDPNFTGPEQPGGSFRGTSQQQSAEERIKQAEERLAWSQQNGADRLELARQGAEIAKMREQRLNDWGPPTISIGDPNNPGGSRVIRRDNLPQGGAAGAPPAGVQTQVLGNETSLSQLGRLKELFDGGGKDVIGPAEGRLRGIGQNIPGIEVDKTFADMQAASAAFRNSVIKAITGAQMSEPEANRIRQQIPDVTNKPEVWLANYAATERNLRDLEAVIARRQGGAQAAPGAPPAPGAPRRRRYDMQGNELP